MSLLSSTNSYLGIDIDSSSIKVVELAHEHGRPRLVTYGYFDRRFSESSASQDNSAYTAQVIQRICRRARTNSTKVISALPVFSVFSSILSLPAMPAKDLSLAVIWQAKKVIPLPIEDMVLDWKLLEETATSELPVRDQVVSDSVTSGLTVEARSTTQIASGIAPKTVKILLTAAPKDLVKKYIDIFKIANTQLLSLDTESFALVRSLVGRDTSALMIVDFGSLVTTISIVVNAIPIVSRSINVGGLLVTKAIANSLGINFARAEQFKYDIGMNQQQSGQGGIPATIQTALAPIVDEITYTLNAYKSQADAKSIEKVILTGGSSLLLQLPEYLADKLSMRVYRGDPWARLVYPEGLRPVLDELGPRFSVAIGLAMRNLE